MSTILGSCHPFNSEEIPNKLNQIQAGAVLSVLHVRKKYASTCWYELKRTTFLYPMLVNIVCILPENQKYGVNGTDLQTVLSGVLFILYSYRVPIGTICENPVMFKLIHENE